MRLRLIYPTPVPIVGATTMTDLNKGAMILRLEGEKVRIEGEKLILSKDVLRIEQALLKAKIKIDDLETKMRGMIPKPKRKRIVRSEEHKAKISEKAKGRGRLSVLPAQIGQAKKSGNFERVAILEAEMAALKAIKVEIVAQVPDVKSVSQMGVIYG
jgi:hypothetical protein